MNMWIWAAIFFVSAIIAGILGFKKKGRKGTQIAKILFFIFLVLFIFAFIWSIINVGWT